MTQVAEQVSLQVAGGELKWGISSARWRRVAAIKGRAASRGEREAPVRLWDTILSVTMRIRRMTRWNLVPMRHAAGQPGQGDGAGQCLPDDVTTPQKSPNKANLESKQSLESQELKPETAGAEGRKQSQSSKGETRRKPSSRDGRAARQSGRWPVASEAEGSGPAPRSSEASGDAPGDRERGMGRDVAGRRRPAAPGVGAAGDGRGEELDDRRVLLLGQDELGGGEPPRTCATPRIRWHSC